MPSTSVKVLISLRLAGLKLLFGAHLERASETSSQSVLAVPARLLMRGCLRITEDNLSESQQQLVLASGRSLSESKAVED